MNDINNSLVTYALFTYNQEPYIRQAVESAFAQTYSPLEIILSDDGSSDRTAEIIRELATSYCGPHTIKINFNKHNKGVSAHVNHLFALARGKLLILAAGDDISHCDRVTNLVRTWQCVRPRPWALHSAARLIDIDGKVVGRYCSRINGQENDVAKLISHYRGALLLGATTAYDIELQSYYGPLQDGLPVEDVPLTIRAAMLGRVAYLDEELVDYRIGIHGWLPHGGNGNTFEKYREIRRFKAYADETMSRQVLADAKTRDNPDFIRMAVAKRAEAEYAALVAASGRPQLCRLISTIKIARRLIPSLALAILFSNKIIEKLYFQFNRRFRATRDTRVFKNVVTSADGR